MNEELEMNAFLIHGRLAELHRLAMEYNKKKGNYYLAAWHKLCVKAEMYMAREHWKAMKGGDDVR